MELIDMIAIIWLTVLHMLFDIAKYIRVFCRVVKSSESAFGINVFQRCSRTPASAGAPLRQGGADLTRCIRSTSHPRFGGGPIETCTARSAR